MENERKTNLIRALENIGYENPDRSADYLIEDLRKKGQFIYVTHPEMVHRGEYHSRDLEPVFTRLSRN